MTLSDVPSDYLHPTDSTADVASPHVGLVTNSNTAVGVKMFFFSLRRATVYVAMDVFGQSTL